jgi:transglutaminase-like putative cysteine protease
MKKSIKVDQKKKRGRPATGRDPMVSSRIPADTVSAVDKWAQHNETTRSDAIRRLVEIGLKAKTPARSVSKPGQRARAQELAAKAIEQIVDPSAPPEERAQRRHRLTKGPTEFREDRVDLPKAKAK